MYENFGQGKKQKTPSTNDNLSAKNNRSLDLNDDGYSEIAVEEPDFEREDEDSQAFFRKRRNHQNFNTPMIVVSSLEGANSKVAHSANNNAGRVNMPTRKDKVRDLREAKLEQFQEMRARAKQETRVLQGFNSNIILGGNPLLSNS